MRYRAIYSYMTSGAYAEFSADTDVEAIEHARRALHQPDDRIVTLAERVNEHTTRPIEIT